MIEMPRCNKTAFQVIFCKKCLVKCYQMRQKLGFGPNDIYENVIKTIQRLWIFINQLKSRIYYIRELAHKYFKLVFQKQLYLFILQIKLKQAHTHQNNKNKINFKLVVIEIDSFHQLQMNRTEQQWNIMKQQLRKLKEQNEQLKRTSQTQVHHETQPQPQGQFDTMKQNDNIVYQQDNQSEQCNKDTCEEKEQSAECPNVLQSSIIIQNSNEIRNELCDSRKTTSMCVFNAVSFGENFFARKSFKSFKSFKNINQEQPVNLNIDSQEKSQLAQDQNLPLIQDIFLFGPSIRNIQDAEQRKFLAGHQLYYPQCQKEAFQVYGNYLFPNQLQVKHIRQRNHSTEVDQIIFKNYKKLDCNIFIFQGQQDNQKLKKPNPILDRVNPSKWLYALSIQFSDFVSVRNQKMASSKNNKSSSINSNNSDRNDGRIEFDIIAEKQQKQGGSLRNNAMNQFQEEIFKSNFCLCVMTYFPFIRFLKDVLIQVFDSVKLKRMNKYNDCGSVFKQIDIYFFIQELKKELSKFLGNELKVQAEMDKMYNFSINQIPMKLDLHEHNLVNEVIADWGFKILKILDNQSLLDIFCYIMMEESICFLSEDRNVLTFVILLYVMVFSLPFGYPHSCVSIIFNQQLLQTPFTAVLGINKSTKWLQQKLTQNKQSKVIVNLNEQQVKIKFQKKPHTYKSQRLKKIFNSFRRKIQTSAIPLLFRKKVQLTNRQTTKEQNQHASQLFAQLSAYYQEEIIGHLPNRQIINLIKCGLVNSKVGEQGDYIKIYQIVIDKVEKYLWESRKSESKDPKDPFIDELIKKQLFRVYIDRYYCMQ